MSFMKRAKKVGKAIGVCSVCGKTHMRDRPTDVAYCDCYRYCPQCGEAMEPYTPENLGKNYNPDKGLHVLFVCRNCSPPYYSKQMPVEVSLE